MPFHYYDDLHVENYRSAQATTQKGYDETTASVVFSHCKIVLPIRLVTLD